MTLSQQIDQRIESLDDWRGQVLSDMRKLIHEADPNVIEAVKWIKPSNPLGVAVWEHDGIICTGEVYKGYVKLTFAQGAALADPANVFNAGFGGGTRRAIDIREGQGVDAGAFRDLIREAVAFNVAKKAAKRG